VADGVRSLRSRAAGLVAAPLVVLVLCAAEDQIQQARARLREMSPEQRNAVVQALNQFDTRLGPTEQQSLRELDRQLAALPGDAKDHYFATLRRYHNWLQSLPENVKDGLLARTPDERMPQIRALLSKYPPPSQRTPFWVQFSDLGGPSAFELAALIKIWRQLTPQQRKEIEQLPLPQRTPRLHQIGRRSFQISREVRPDDFALDQWILKAEAKLAELRIIGPELKAAAAAAGQPPPEAAAPRKALVKDQVRLAVMHRFAINLYGLENPPKPVSPERLDRFLAELPPWVRSTFDASADDEARRKLSMAYRLVFPYPDEFKPGQSVAQEKSEPGRTGAAPPPPAPAPASKKPAQHPAPGSTTPF
jgi:hypothetical protein